MPKPNYSLQDIENLSDKGLLTRNERMLLRQDYYQEVNREPTFVESVTDAVMTPIRAVQQILDDQARQLRDRAATVRLEQQQRDRLFAERSRTLAETPSPIDMELNAWRDEQGRKLEALKAARDLPQPRPNWKPEIQSGGHYDAMRKDQR